MAEAGALPRLNQSVNRANQAKMEERQQLSLAAMGKVAFDGAIRNELQRATNSLLESILNMMKEAESARAFNAARELEENREGRRKLNAVLDQDLALQNQNQNDLKLQDFLGIGAFIAGVTSIAGAFVGLRGWEINAVRQIKDAIPTTKRVVEGVKILRNAILLSLGMSQTTLINRQLMPQGKPFSTTLIDGVSRFVNTIRGALGALASPGGLNLRNIPGIGLGKKIMGFIRGIGSFFGTILSPIFQAVKTLATSVTAIYNSTLAPIFTVMKGGAGFFLAVFKKIFLPIGALFSLFDGAKEFMRTEGNLFEKLNAGIAKTFADFIGAPFDLLKKGLAKLTEKFGFEKFAKKINDFSVEDTLFKIFKLPGQAIGAIFGAGKKLLQGDFSGAARELVDPILNFFKAISNAFMNFIRRIPVINKFFEDESEEVNKELDKVENKKLKQLERQERQAEAELKATEEILKIKEEMKALLDGRDKSELRNQERADFNKLQRLLNREEKSLELAQTRLADVNEQLAKLQKKEDELTAKLAKQDVFLPTPTLGSTPSGNGSADMLNALANFSGDGFGATRLTDNSTTVGDSTSVAINNQSFQTGPRVKSEFRNYFST